METRAVFSLASVAAVALTCVISANFENRMRVGHHLTCYDITGNGSLPSGGRKRSASPHPPVGEADA
eukprot:2168035-Pyramimonas_sp.AAC.1